MEREWAGMVLVADPHEGLVPVDDLVEGFTGIDDPLEGFTPVDDPLDAFPPADDPLPHPALQSLTPATPATPATTTAAAMERDEWLRCRAAWTDAGWFDAPLRPAVQRLLALAPGPDLVTALSGLPVRGRCPADPVTGHASFADPAAPGYAEVGRPGAPCACMIVVTAAWSAVSSWADARHTRAMVNAVGAQPVTVPFDPDNARMGTIVDAAVDEVAPALRLSPRSCALRAASAREVYAQPDLLTAVETGLVSSWTARLVTQDLANLSQSERDVVIDILLSRLADRHRRGLHAWNFSELRAAVNRIIATVSVDFSRARRRARKGRNVAVHDLGDGMAQLIAELPGDIAHRIYRRLTAISRELPPDDPRCRDQQRADVLADLVLDGPVDTDAVPAAGGPPAHGSGTPDPATDSDNQGSGTQDHSAQGSAAPASPSTHPRPPSPTTQPRPRPCGHCGEVDVVIDLATLLGMAADPAMLAGWGPIPSDIARELAADRAWRLWITHSTAGHVIATSASTYRPPPKLARLLRAREPHCRFPGCRTAAEHCDLDHAIPWPEGPTSAQNLGALCRRHHRMKTRGDWRLSTSIAGPDGGPNPGGDLRPPSLHWTSPAGISSCDEPPRPLLDP